MARQNSDRTALARRGARSMAASNGTANGRALAGAEHEQNGEMAALLGSIRRRWLLMLSLGLIVSATAVSLIWFLVEPPYRAAAEIQIREVPDRILFKTEETSGFDTYKQTQMRLAKSSFVLSAALRDPAIAQLSLVREQQHPIDWLQKELKIDSPAIEFIQISLEGDRPEELAAVVNAVTEAYKVEVIGAEENRKNQRLKELRKVEERIEIDLRDKRSQMQSLAKALSTADSETLSTKQQLAIEYFGQLRREHAQIRFELMRTQARIAAKRQGREDPEDVDFDPGIVKAKLEEVQEIRQHKRRSQQLASVIREMKKEFNSEHHPAIVEVEAELAGMEDELNELREKLQPAVEETLRREMVESQSTNLAQLEQQAEVLTVQFDEIEKELDAQKIETNQIGLTSYQLEVHKQRVAEIQQMDEQIKERIRQIEIELDAQPRIDVFQKAQTPHTPMIMRKFKMMGFAGLGGFACIAGLILWIDLRSKRISCISEVAQGLKMPILGALPIMPRGLIEGKGKKGGRPQALLGIWKESIDSTRAMLLSHAGPKGHREHQTILVTSALSGEGKTTLACHLAISLAQTGRRTLLVDADLRRPAIHQVFGITASPGLSDVLRQEAQWDDVVQNQVIPGLAVIPAGQVDPYSLQMLAADAAGPLLEELRKHYDFIIVDSAPVLTVTDALMIGPHADGALFAVRRDVSRRGKVSSACERLERVGVPLLGAVVIGLDSQEPTDRYTPITTQQMDAETAAAFRTATTVN